jgi:hypothetical protein
VIIGGTKDHAKLKKQPSNNERTSASDALFTLVRKAESCVEVFSLTITSMPPSDSFFCFTPLPQIEVKMK